MIGRLSRAGGNRNASALRFPIKLGMTTNLNDFYEINYSASSSVINLIESSESTIKRSL